MAGLNRSITVSFLSRSHEVFAQLVLWAFWVSVLSDKNGYLDDIIKVVESSAMVNHAQLLGTQDGQIIVPTYIWAQFQQSFPTDSS